MHAGPGWHTPSAPAAPQQGPSPNLATPNLAQAPNFTDAASWSQSHPPPAVDNVTTPVYFTITLTGTDAVVIRLPHPV